MTSTDWRTNRRNALKQTTPSTQAEELVQCCKCKHTMWTHQAPGSECTFSDCPCGRFVLATPTDIATWYLAKISADVCFDVEKREMAQAVVELTAELARVQALVEAAIEVRNGRYSINGKLSREDRTLFDRFNQAVDAWRYEDEAAIDTATTAMPSAREGDE